MLLSFLLLVVRLLFSRLLKLLNVLVTFQSQFELLGRLGAASLKHHLLTVRRCLIGVEDSVGVLLLENYVCSLYGSYCLLVEYLAVDPGIPFDAELVDALLYLEDLLTAERGQIAAVSRLPE